MDVLLQQSKALKTALVEFILDADGELAQALEVFCAEKLLLWSKNKLQGIRCSDLAIDMFVTEGHVAGQSVLDRFIASHPDLSSTDRTWLKGWQRSFNGLFVIQQVGVNGYTVMNWLTEKQYQVKPNGCQADATLTRLAPGEVIVARLAPVTQDDWTFSGPLLLLGKLGKVKLAVAIGNFKNWFPHHLYSDAPELLEAAWTSVDRYYQEFVEFFGGDRLTLSGYELGKKLNEYQDLTTQRRLADVGLDRSQSLRELANQAGVSEAEMAASMAELGEDGKMVRRLLDHPQAAKMVMPPIKLPDELRQAEAVTILVHPRWGQLFLPDYGRLVDLLQQSDQDSMDACDRLLLKYLRDDSVTTYVWRCLAEELPNSLEVALRRVLDQPNFAIAHDLEPVLMQAGKPLEPRLPEIASVPLHLHNLFQAALQQIDRDTSAQKKAKGEKKRKVGFGA